MKKNNKDIAVAILAGGYGTRLSEKTKDIPKPLVKIGNKPIIWHIIKHYEYYGFKKFIICCGYKGNLIKKFISNEKKKLKDLDIITINTGIKSLTAKRVIKIKKYLTNTFCLTYGDAVADVNLSNLIKYHKRKKSDFTVTGVIPISRYGSLKINKKNKIIKFMEKKDFKDNYINGGYFVINKNILKFISPRKNQMLEEEPMRKIVKEKNMFVYKHRSFWQCMDTLRDNILLNKMWRKKPKWKIWRN